MRELILGGELKTGAPIAKRWLVERLGVSRPLVRLALVRHAEQGLLDALPSGGYAVKEFSESDVQDAIEVRGRLEGLAARLAAERGVSPVLITKARECLERIDTALAQPALTDATFSVCVEANARCYALLSGMAGSALVACQLDKAMALPFASPNGFVMAHSVGPRARDVLVVAQEQHRMVIEAIVQREGARAEGLMREHARIAWRNFQQALRRVGHSCTGPRTTSSRRWARLNTLGVAGGIGITPIVGMAPQPSARGADVRLPQAARETQELAVADVLHAALGKQLQTCVDAEGQRIDIAAHIAALARAAFWVELSRHGLKLEVPADRTLRDVLPEAGIEARFDCQRRECGLCAMDMLSAHGSVDHRDVCFSACEKQANQRLCTCVSSVSRVWRVTGGGAWCSPRPGEVIDDAERCKPCSSPRGSPRGSLHYPRPLFGIRHPETRNGDTP